MHVPDLITAQVCSRTNYVAVLLVVSPHTFTKSSYYKKIYVSGFSTHRLLIFFVVLSVLTLANA
ncbi:unnamed protein product [Ixodes persulcatus]